MKFLKGLICFLVFCFSFSWTNCYAFSSGFETKTLSEVETSELVSKINFTVIDEPEANIQHTSFDCFSVNRFGIIALGYCNNKNEGYVILLDHSKPIRLFKFYCNGSFQIELGEEELNIHHIRSSVITKYTLTGELIGAAKVLETEKNNSYRNQLYDKTIYSFDGTDYIATRSAFNFNELIISCSDGTETIVCSSSQYDNIILCLIAILIPCVIPLIFRSVFKQTAERKKCNE